MNCRSCGFVDCPGIMSGVCPRWAVPIFDALTPGEVTTLRKAMRRAVHASAQLAIFAASYAPLHDPVAETMRDLAALHTELCDA